MPGPRREDSSAPCRDTCSKHGLFLQVAENSRTSRYDFWTMVTMMSQTPSRQTLQRRRQEVLSEYGVDTVSDLPINFDGVAMQLDEEFANQIWDEHHGKLESRMLRQSQLGSWGAVINPFQSVDHISMTVAGTDLLHDLDFLHQAESYRRMLVGKLNHEHAYGGSKTGDRSFKATPEFFASIAPFDYAAPHLSEVVHHRLKELIALVFWLIILVALLLRGGDRMERGTLPC